MAGKSRKSAVRGVAGGASRAQFAAQNRDFSLLCTSNSLHIPVNAMGRFRLDSSYTRGTLRFLLQGTFDGSSAWEVRHALSGADAGRVILDFTGIEEAWEFGAAVLAAGLKRMDRSRIAFANVPPDVVEALSLFGIHVDGRDAPGLPDEPLLAAAENA